MIAKKQKYNIRLKRGKGAKVWKLETLFENYTIKNE